MIYLKITTLVLLFLVHSSICHGDICHINGVSQEDLKNLSYDPPGDELLSKEQDKKAWQTFIENYEIPIRKVQDWYNSIVDKQSADAAADSFNKDVLPILKKLTGRAADMKNRLLLFQLLLKCRNSYSYAFLSCRDDC